MRGGQHHGATKMSARRRKPMSAGRRKPMSAQRRKPMSAQRRKPMSVQRRKPMSAQRRKPMSAQRRKPMTAYSKGNCNELPLSAAAASDVWFFSETKYVHQCVDYTQLYIAYTDTP